MSEPMKVVRAVIVAGLVVTAATACSSSSSVPPPTSAATSTAPAPSSPTAGAIGPVILTPDSREGTVPLGRTVVFDLGDAPDTWDLVSSDPAVVALTPGGTRDGATFNWGGDTLAVGKVAVIATPQGAGTPVTFIVTVTAAP